MRNLLLALRAVLSAFSGVQKSKTAAPPQLHAVHYVVAGIIALLCFIMLIVTAVNLIV